MSRYVRVEKNTDDFPSWMQKLEEDKGRDLEVKGSAESEIGWGNAIRELKHEWKLGNQ